MADISNVAAANQGIDWNNIFGTIKQAAQTVKEVKDINKAPQGVVSYQQPSAFTTNTGAVNWTAIALAGGGLIAVLLVVRMIKKRG